VAQVTGCGSQLRPPARSPRRTGTAVRPFPSRTLQSIPLRFRTTAPIAEHQASSSGERAAGPRRSSSFARCSSAGSTPSDLATVACSSTSCAVGLEGTASTGLSKRISLPPGRSQVRNSERRGRPVELEERPTASLSSASLSTGVPAFDRLVMGGDSEPRRRGRADLTPTAPGLPPTLDVGPGCLTAAAARTTTRGREATTGGHAR
jgi:hypothetical protein